MSESTGMSGFLTALTGTNGITSDNMWAQITPAAETIGKIVIFAFGYYVLRKLIKGASRGKAKI